MRNDLLVLHCLMARYDFYAPHIVQGGEGVVGEPLLST